MNKTNSFLDSISFPNGVNVRKLPRETFNALAVAFDDFIESINNTPDVKAHEEFGNDSFSCACAQFYDAMQAYRARNKIERGIV